MVYWPKQKCLFAPAVSSCAKPDFQIANGPVNDTLDSLPWLLAAVAALLVGGVSLISGGLVWDSLEKAGAAFVAFGLIGAIIRKILVAASNSGQQDRDRAKADTGGHAGGNDRPDGSPNDESR